MKIAVYGICKNEEQFVDRWMDSMSEADEVVVLDTGSEDATVEKLRARGAKVTQEIIRPWRFDVARNRSLALVSEDTDVCICTDLDEVFASKGWRKEIEKHWVKGTTRMKYPYIWSFTPEGKPAVHFHIEKIHARHGFAWIHPVHEVLAYRGEGPDISRLCDSIEVHHHPDHTKPRAQYLPLLELSVAEDPDDDRNLHYLGREYLYYGRWDDCIATLQRHLALQGARWADERCASMRYIARAYGEKGDALNRKRWLCRAIAEAPHLREPYVEMAFCCYDGQDWPGVFAAVSEALKITSPPISYINEPSSWDHTLYDLGAIACWHLGLQSLSETWAREAVRLSPQLSRLRENLRCIENTRQQPASSGE